MNRIGVVVVAGGSGSRMKNSLPKQFIPVLDKPILQYTIDRFFEWNSAIQLILVLPEDQIDHWNNIKSESTRPYKICGGGKERFHSVKNGLNALENVDHVMIHDGVRPLFSDQLLDRCVNALEKHSGVIPVVSPKESLRQISDKGSQHIDRAKIKMVQTPQCFHYNEINNAFSQEFDTLFTDDASVFEKTGAAVHLVEGEYTNIKVTTPEDLLCLEIYLKKKA